MQDLPRISTIDSTGSSDCFTDLLVYLRTLGINEDLLRTADILCFDWSKIKVKLICSYPGMTSSRSGSGISLLSRSVLSYKEIKKIECHGSSIGTMTDEWINDFVNGVKGDICNEAVDLSVVFPTMKYAFDSPEGAGSFGTIFCSPDQWEKYSDKVKTKFYRSESSFGKGQPLHAKLVVAFDSLDNIKWCYFGSANFTPSAWGKFVKNKNNILIANYELGVLIDENVIKDLCPEGFPFPYQRPLTQYESDDVPWMQKLVLE